MMPRGIRWNLSRTLNRARFVYRLAALASVLLFAAVFAVASPSSSAPKRVLLLMQEDLSWPIFRTIDENARATLRNGSPDGVVIFSEHMDRIHFPDPRFQAQQAAWIQQKYVNSGLDLVIAVGDVPTNLFPRVPLLYVSASPQHKIPNLSPSTVNAAAIWVELDAGKTLAFARLLQPDARELYVVAGSSPSDIQFLDQIRGQVAAYSDRLKITYVTDLTLDQICDKVATIGSDSIVLFVAMSRDAKGNPFVSADVVRRVLARSKAPIYVMLDTHMGSGAVGGYVTRFGEMGKQAGEMALQMLAGQHPADAVGRSGYLADWRQLRRWNFPESALPEGVTVQHRDLSIWETYKYYILAALLLCLLEGLLIIRLLWERRQRMRSESSLSDRLSFERLLSDLSTMFISLPEELVEATVQDSLVRMAKFMRIERITLLEFSQERTDLVATFAWHGEGAHPLPLTLSADSFPRWVNALRRGECVHVTDVESLSAAASSEKKYLQKIGAVSVAAVPLKAGDEFFGGLVFVSTQRRVVWEEGLLKQLTLVAQILSNALMRKRAHEAGFRHRAIVESSDDAIISKNLQGVIQSWNAGAERMFGYTESETLGQPITILIPEELYSEEVEILERLNRGEGIEHYETIRLVRDGKRLEVSLTISPVRDSAGKVVGVSTIARNITERKRAEQALRESEERFRLVANTAPVLIWMCGVERDYNFFNQSWLDFTGRRMEQELDGGWLAGMHEEDVPRWRDVSSASFESGTEFEVEYRLCRYDGESRWILEHGVPRFESDGAFSGYIGSCLDITERKASEEVLHNLSGRLIRAQEEERARIARELHDDFSQRLALMGIHLGQLWKKLDESQVEERAKITSLLKAAKEISSDMHTLSHQLHSSKLEHVGLVSALSGLCREIGEMYKIDIEFIESGVLPKISDDLALCLFRVTQEALGNIVKHSRATSAHVSLNVGGDLLNLEIRDDGEGFDLEVRNVNGGIGLISMRERLRLVRGRLSITSERGQGTALSVEVPLRPPAVVASSEDAKELRI